MGRLIVSANGLYSNHAMSTCEIILEPKPKTFGILSVIAGVLGLLAIAVGPFIRDMIVPPAPAEKHLSETILGIKRHIGPKAQGNPPPAEGPRQLFSAKELPRTLSVVLSALAIIGGAASFLLREGHRDACIAGGLGLVTLYWHTVLLALAALFLFFVLYYLLRFFELLE